MTPRASSVRITYPTALVLAALADGRRWGFEIIDATGLGAGTVYPILRRLEHAALATSRWESERTALSDDRPQRRYYRLTARGIDVAQHARARYPHVGLAAAAPRAQPT